MIKNFKKFENENDNENILAINKSKSLKNLLLQWLQFQNLISKMEILGI